MIHNAKVTIHYPTAEAVKEIMKTMDVLEIEVDETFTWPETLDFEDTHIKKIVFQKL